MYSVISLRKAVAELLEFIVCARIGRVADDDGGRRTNGTRTADWGKLHNKNLSIQVSDYYLSLPVNNVEL